MCGNIGKQVITVQLDFVAALLKGYAKHIFMFNRGRLIARIYPDDVVRAFALVLQDFQRLLRIARSNDAIGDFAMNEGRCFFVAHIAQGNEIAIRRHTVGTAGTHVCTSQRGKRQVICKINLLQRFVQRQTYGCTCLNDVAAGIPVASFSSFTNCHPFSASRKLM